MQLIERHQALDDLHSRLTALEHTPAVVLIAGPPAIGKSALLREFGRRAAGTGPVLLTAGCAADEQGLPLGLIAQLFGDSRLPAALVQSVRVAADRLAEADVPVRGDGLDPATAGLAREIQRQVQELAEAGGLIICVDDLHQADHVSQQVLLYLTRRMHTSGLMAVVTAPSVDDITLPALHSEIVRHPCFRQITLGLLSPAGIGQAIGPAASTEQVERAHRLSGGNPLLLRALLTDGLDGDGPTGQPGASFRDALSATVSRLDPTTAGALRAAAIWPGPINPMVLGRLLLIEDEPARTALDRLRGSGLLDPSGGCQPAVATVLLTTMEPTLRTDLRRRAARLADETGCGPAVVAEHLIAAGHPCEPWAGRVLIEAAAQAQAAGEPGFAVDCLELAARSSADETERARMVMGLARIEWRDEPSTAARHLAGLLDAARADRLCPADVAMLTGWLLWLGRTQDATETMDWILADQQRATDPAVRAVLTSLRSQFPLTVPAGPLWSMPEDLAALPVELAAHSAIVATGVLSTALAQAPDDQVHARAEQVLANCELSDDTLSAVVAALQALIYTDRLDVALNWCTTLLAAARHRPAATWEAVLGTLRAELALRHGTLSEALTWSEFALDRISRRSWGVGLAWPMAVRLQALLGTGDLDEAAGLARTVLPAESYRTRYGLAFLDARAQFHLATNKFHLAQADFARCAELAGELDCDRPALVPWRTGYARLHLRLEHSKAALDLMNEQLARPGGQGARVRGQSLCVIAAAGDPRRRPTLLREAVDLLQVSGDRAGLATALAELSTAYHQLSEFTRSRLMSRRAQEVAADCGSSSSCRSLLIGVSAPATPADGPPAPEAPDLLSDAERRVAELAVMGHTNREISNKLFITVSTVEQHLTRIYRKLGVTRRIDLPMQLRHSDRTPASLLSVAG